jgi:outer membrane protein assembly factor BamD
MPLGGPGVQSLWAIILLIFHESLTMSKNILPSLALILAFLVAGCGTTSERDETIGWTAQRIYAEAKESMGDGAYDRAIRLFERLEARYPYGPYAQQAQLETAYAYYKSQEPAAALAAADRFIRLYPNHHRVDYVYYLKGLIHFNEDLGLLGHLSAQDMSERDPRAARESFDSFRQLVERFPQSPYTEDARQRLVYLLDALARHEVHVARYYFTRSAYAAAMGRAQAAIRDFPETPSVEEALYLLEVSAKELGLDAQSQDARRILETNFPKSPWLSGGPSASRPWWRFW